ncbi:uncharacterized protein LOC107266173 [Cephus cinctus]|uniref:Uncharacterized protein LOC107266173 n=1 Tax=Cephus cinctus TaxID=211228 RepID=A0AAJ7BQN3_CEPCN|nr:uncharacterized protein LOC107266173 [Cephus cinctus]
MWYLLPLLMAFLRTATSRTEPLLDMSSQGHRNDLPYSFENLNGPSDLHPLNLPASIPKPEIDLDRSNQPHEWLDSKFPSSVSRLEKLAALEELGDNRFINIDEQGESREEMEDTEFTRLSGLLTKILQEPGTWEAPLILVEEPNLWNDSEDRNESEDKFENEPTVWKRSRYYRRYPWKRQNSRSRNSYDYDSSRYLCTPTREDVFQLLVALHDARQGNKSRTVNFCNRRRPAGAVFTNIRFLGRRK